MLGGIEWEDTGKVGIDGVTNETPGGMRVETDHEKECKVVCIPESLKALVADLVMGRGIHQDHDE